jgi:hypothetical protein
LSRLEFTCSLWNLSAYHLDRSVPGIAHLEAMQGEQRANPIGLRVVADRLEASPFGGPGPGPALRGDRIGRGIFVELSD